MQLSPSLLTQLEHAIKNSIPSQCCQHFRNKLTPEQLTEVRVWVHEEEPTDLSMAFWDDYNMMEREHLVSVMSEYLPQMEDENSEQLSDEDLMFLIEKYDLVSSAPNIATLLSIPFPVVGVLTNNTIPSSMDLSIPSCHLSSIICSHHSSTKNKQL